MSHRHGEYDGSVEVAFDVRKPSGPVEFLGLLDGLGGFGNKLSGLFGWVCPACGTSNKDTAVIEPNQSLLMQWSCNHCSQAMFIRFLARPATDWITQHAVAITGKALCHMADGPPTPEYATRQGKRPTRSSQRVFAWITVPALAAVIFLGLADMRRAGSSLASLGGEGGRHASASYAWLGGHWVSDDMSDALYFGYVNPARRSGTYTRVSRSGRPTDIVRFEIVHEETTDDRLVLRELDGPQDPTAPESVCPNAILYIARQGTLMMRMTTQQGEPVLTVYRLVDKERPDS